MTGRAIVLLTCLLTGCTLHVEGSEVSSVEASLDLALQDTLTEHGFSGRVQSELTARLGRALDEPLANLGRLMFFDTLLGLNDDNSCSGCHSPLNAFGDSQPIAIGVENEGGVGPHRRGPRNQRRTPGIVNTAFFPNLMWNSRFAARTGDPFDNSAGFVFTAPEGSSLDAQPTLLTAQAFIPPTEQSEMAGFEVDPDHDSIRQAVIARLNANGEYLRLFGELFPEVRDTSCITYDMLAAAIAEFEFSQTYADAPIDRFARGELGAMSVEEKEGALLFFGRAGCITCHATSGRNNEMFSDFTPRNIGVPQLAPLETNVVYDGPRANEDFGLEQVTARRSDRYKFRSSPLRNVALQARFFHNGSFDSLESSVRHHLDVEASLASFSLEHCPPDLRHPTPPRTVVLENLDPLVAAPLHLTDLEVDRLVRFLEVSLTDPRARPEALRSTIPRQLPSRLPVHVFE